MRPALGLEIQVVQDEAQVGLARAVVGQRHGVAVGPQLLEDGLDELVQVVDLLELAARILVELAVAREDVQRLEQLDALAGLELQLGRNVLGRRLQLGRRSQRPGLSCRAWPSVPAFWGSPWPVTGQRAPTSRSSQPSRPMSSSTSMLRS
jgi:hypothetical protein